MIDFGTVRPGSTLDIPFATYNSSGASVTLTGLAVTDIEIYKNGSTTQRASDTGYSLLDTDGTDFDSVTGLHAFSIDLSSNADSGFFVAGGRYWVVVSAVTVDSQTVSFIAATFRIGYAEAIVNTTIATLASQTSFTLTAGSADNSAYVGCLAVVHDVASSVQMCIGVISAYTGSTKTITLAASPGIFTMAAGDNISILPPSNTRWAGTTLWGSGAITAASIASNAITAAKIATDAITAAKIAADAIGASELAADAVAEIADGVWDEVLTGATHNVASSAGRRLRTLQDFGVYALGRVWVDEDNGSSTGTTFGEDATVTNRANDLDNAQTVADNANIHDINITNGNSITLTAALEGYDVYGNLVTLALGGQDIGGSEFFDFADISGIGTTTGARVVFTGCDLGNCTLPGDTSMVGCGLEGTITLGAAGDMHLVDCYSEVAGASAPTIDLAAVGASDLSIRRWSGGLNINNVATGDTVSVDVVSGGTITINGTGGTVVVRGMCSVTDSSGGAVTITQEAVINRSAINAEADTAISDASLATAAALATVDGNVDSILEDTGTTLPATLATIAGYIDTEVAAILADTGTTLDGKIDAIKAVTDLLVAAHAEPTGVPAANETPLDKIGYLFMMHRNKVTVTATKKTFFGDDDAAEFEKDTSDDGTTFTESEINAV